MTEESQGNPLKSRSVIVRPTVLSCFLLLAVLLSTFLYFPLNHASPDAHTLTPAWNGRLPLIPVFAAPYLIFLPVFWLTVAYAFASGRGFTMFALAITIVYFASDLAYALYPTYVPRPEHVTGFLGGLARYVYAHDNPYNDFPSEHASSAVLLAFYLWPRGRVPRSVGLAFAVLVVPATMLIKQHSVAGATGGVVLAVAVWAALSYVLRRFPGQWPRA